MPITTGTVNPTSTVTLASPAGRASGAEPNNLRFSIAASGTATFSIETEAYPCAFEVITDNGTNPVRGMIVAYNSSTIDVAGGSGLVDGAAAANQLGAAISSGTITLTAHSTFTTAVVRVARIV